MMRLEEGRGAAEAVRVGEVAIGRAKVTALDGFPREDATMPKWCCTREKEGRKRIIELLQVKTVQKRGHVNQPTSYRSAQCPSCRTCSHLTSTVRSRQ